MNINNNMNSLYQFKTINPKIIDNIDKNKCNMAENS